MKKLLTFKMMIIRQIFSFLKNVLIFLIDRLYKEGEYMLGRGQRNYSDEASERGGLFAKQLIENKNERAGKYDPYAMDGKFIISYRTASVVFSKARLTGCPLRRIHTCSLTEEGSRLFINANLAAGPLTYESQIVFRLGNFMRKVAVVVSSTDLKVSVDFSVEKETGRNGFLLNCALNELNGFKLRVNGFGYFDWAINLFLSFWTLILRRIFRNLLEKELEQCILDRLQNYQFPVEGTSHRKETEFNNQDEIMQINEVSASLSESFDTKQSPGMPNWPMSPIRKSCAYDKHNSEEYGTEKDLGPDLEITYTSSCFPETNKWISERNSFDLPSRNMDLCNEISKDKCDLVSKLSRETRELTRSHEMMQDNLDLIHHTINRLSKDNALKKCLEILGKDDKENTNSASSSPSKRLENEELFEICERRKAKSKLEDLSQMLRDSCKDQLEIASKVGNENHGQSELLEIQEPSNKKVDVDASNMGIKSPSRVDNCDSSPSTKLESSQIHENIFEPSSTETGIFVNITPDFDSKRRKVQIDHLENLFNGKKRKERSEDSNKNRISIESFNHCQALEENFSVQNPDLKLCSTGMFQNESLISCTVSEFEKHLKVRSNVSSRKVECQIDDPESAKSYDTENLCRNRGVKSPEILCNCNPEDEVDGRNLSRSNIVSDSMQQKEIQHEKSLDLEVDTETVSTCPQFNEKHENKVNEKIPFKYVKVHTEEELKEGSQLKEDEGCSVVYSSSSAESSYSSQLHPIAVHFPVFPAIPVRCETLTEAQLGWKIHPFSVNSFKAPEIFMSSKMEEKSDSTNHITNSQSEDCSLEEELACMYEKHAECTDSMAEISNAAGLKLNENSNKSRLEMATDLKSLLDLQEEIIAETPKMLSDVALESEPESDVDSSSVPYSRHENLEYLKKESIYNEFNKVQQKDSKADVGVFSRLDDRPTLLSVKEYYP